MKISSFEKIQAERRSLPIFQYKDEFLNHVKNNQILLIIGRVGSGKTTQITQFLHEAGYTKHGKICCTQPRGIATASAAIRVSEEMGFELGDEVGYCRRFETCTSERTIIKYMTEEILVREFLVEKHLSSYSVVMMDEAHERTVSTDILLAFIKEIIPSRPDMKLLISSATLDVKKFSEYFGSVAIVEIPGTRYPLEIYHAKTPVTNYVDAAIQTVLQIHAFQPDGDILVFLTGKEEIETVDNVLSTKSEFIVCPAYGNFGNFRAKIVKRTPKYARKVILTTNAAETGFLTGVKYVVDSGFVKKKWYNPKTGRASLQVTPVSKASSVQRAGRSISTGPGKCFRLYTARHFHDLEKNDIPEIQRTDVANVVLFMYSLGIYDIVNFDFLDLPSNETLEKAEELLYALGALNVSGHLTEDGRKMAQICYLFDQPMVAKMLIASERYGCSAEITSICAMLSLANSIFYRPKDNQVQADTARSKFHSGNDGDFLELLKVYNSWKEAEYSTQWCQDNFIEVRSMFRAKRIREELEEIMKSIDISTSQNGNVTVLKKCIVAGFFPNSAKLHKYGVYKTVKQSQVVYIHPSSSLYQSLPRCVVYHELVETTKEYMRQVTEVKLEWLIEIAPHFFRMEEVKGCFLEVDFTEDVGSCYTNFSISLVN